MRNGYIKFNYFFPRRLLRALFTILYNAFFIVLSERFLLEINTCLKFASSEELQSIFLIMATIHLAMFPFLHWLLGTSELDRGLISYKPCLLE